MKRRSLVTLATAAGAAYASGLRAQAQELRLGAINPLSGALALYGDELTRGYELAAEAANAKGGVLGRRVVIVRGNASTPQEGIAAVEQLANRDRVEVFIGTYISAVSNAASEAALANDKLYWDTNALAAELTERGLENFIRSGPWSGAFAARSVEVTLALIAQSLGKQPRDLRVWVEHEDSIYGTSIAREQERLLREAGVQLAGVGAHNFRSVDLSPSILRARNANPDVWIQTGYIPDTNLLLRTSRDQGFKPGAMLLVGTGDTFEVLEALGKEFLEGIMVVSYPRPDVNEHFGPGAKAFLAAYQAKYGRDPIAPQAMAAYVGAQILLETIAAAGSTQVRAVRAAASRMDRPLSSYATGFGVKFDAKFQNTRAFPTVAQWQDGRMVTVFPTEAVAEGARLVDPRRR
jgi:branched-chain amino acid transport system substrate-binding protein